MEKIRENGELSISHRNTKMFIAEQWRKFSSKNYIFFEVIFEKTTLSPSTGIPEAS